MIIVSFAGQYKGKAKTFKLIVNIPQMAILEYIDKGTDRTRTWKDVVNGLNLVLAEKPKEDDKDGENRDEFLNKSIENLVRLGVIKINGADASKLFPDDSDQVCINSEFTYSGKRVDCRSQEGLEHSNTTQDMVFIDGETMRCAKQHMRVLAKAKAASFSQSE